MRRSEIQGERLHLFRPFLALIALGAFLGAMFLPQRIHAARNQQDTKQQDTKQQNAKQENNKDAEKLTQGSKEKFTAEQIVESVIYLYGTRPGMEQIRRYGVERGKITRYPADGNADEANYERRFVRGENLDKDKIRLDQKLPTMEYSLIFDDGELWGLINGAAFTPRQA